MHKILHSVLVIHIGSRNSCFKILNSVIKYQLLTYYFIGITDIYKQNNGNCTIGFRNKQILFSKSVSYEELANMTKNIYACWFKFLTCENYLYIEGKKCIYLFLQWFLRQSVVISQISILILSRLLTKEICHGFDEVIFFCKFYIHFFLKPSMSKIKPYG